LFTNDCEHLAMGAFQPALKSIRRNDSTLVVRSVSLLRYRDFRRLIGAQAVSQMSDAMASVLLASVLLFANDQGPAVTRLMALVATSAVPLFVAGPLGGVAADRLMRRRILSTGQVARALMVASISIALAIDQIGVVFVLWAMGLCATRVLYTARIASLRHLVRQHELVAADSLSLTTSAVSGVIGAALGLMLSEVVGPGALVVVVVGHSLSASLYGSISANLGGGREHVSAQWRSVARHVWAPKIRFAIIATSTHRFLFGALFATAALVGEDAANGSAMPYVAVLGVCVVGAFAGNISAEWVNENIERRTMAVIVMITSCIASVAAGALSSPVVYLLALLVGAYLFQNLRVCSDATVQSNALTGAGGREFAIYDVTYNLAFLAGVLTGLTSLPTTGGRAIVFLIAGGFALSGLVLSVL